MHEEKLKKRKQRFVFEKRKKAGFDDLSEGGTYSVRSGRSGDVDEGFGVSMMSADITTATWGGSTQPSSTQNDSAVSADGSDVENRGEVRETFVLYFLFLLFWSFVTFKFSARAHHKITVSA